MMPANTTVANGITVQYQATGTTNATAALDGVSLNASYYKRPYTGTGSQLVVQSPAGACDNSVTGAQWIFGGDSHVHEFLHERHSIVVHAPVLHFPDPVPEADLNGGLKKRRTYD